MSLVVVDTDVASTLLRHRAPDALARQLAGQTIAITFVTYGELTKWTLVRRWGPRSLDTSNIKDYVDYAEHEGLVLVR